VIKHCAPWKFLILAIGALMVSACSNPEEKTEKVIFRYNEAAGITSLDPAFTRSLENIWAVNQLFNSLVELDSNMVVIPSLATEWQISEDGLEYTFKLRDDVYFHNHEVFPAGKGRLVTAHDFVYSFQRLLDKSLAAPGVWVFSAVDTGKKGGFEAVDNQTLKIYLKHAFPPFLGILSMKYCSVVPKEAAEHFGVDFRNNPVGTGPFRFKAWVEGTKLVLTRNEAYFERDEQGNQLPYLDGVAVSFVKDPGAVFLDLLKGNFDFMSGLHTSYKDELIDAFGDMNGVYRDELYMQKQPFLKTDYLGFLIDDELETVKQSPLRHRQVRQAINYAIDRDQMVKYLRNNIFYPANSGFVPFGMPGFDGQKVVGYHRDIDKANALLREAGYKSGKDLGTITLSTTADYVDLCEFVQNQLRDLDIDIKVDILPAGSHGEYTANSKLMFFRKSWLADYADAENFLSVFYSPNFAPNGPNYTHFKNAQFDALYDKSMTLNNLEDRIPLYQQMDSLVMAEAPIVPLYYDVVVRFVRNDVSGLRSNAMNLLDLRRVRKLK
jgi:oligopeptide transport system substrate-binding protein